VFGGDEQHRTSGLKALAEGGPLRG
jgi:hypothetical protein